MKRIDNNLIFIALAALLFFLFFGLGNTEALRQGTEGFYLQVSKEMFLKNSFLTPYYLGENHWSKPPLHFWNANAYFHVFGKSTLFLSRLSNLILSLGTLLLLSKWFAGRTRHDWKLIFLYLGSGLFFLKYSRIYMMEMPLTMLTTLASCYFYDYLKKPGPKYLWISATFGALSILIKGPVSLVMICLGLSAFIVYEYVRYKRFDLFPYIKWFILTLLLGSIWFVACYIKYGMEFIDYFFLRENLGKFEAKSYPMRSVVQGLLLYGLPWSIITIKAFSSKFFRQQLINKELNFYILVNFLSFFLLWFIPSQRSHHYAVPSLPFFLMLGLIYLQDFPVIKKYQFFTLRMFLTIFSVIAIALTLFVTFSPFRSMLEISWPLCISWIVFFGASLYLALRPKRIEYLILSTTLLIGNLWVLFIPSFALPLTPGKVVSIVGNSPVAACVRKPYFVKEVLGREITVLDETMIIPHLARTKGYAVLNKNVFVARNIGEIADIVYSWPVWKRGIKAPAIASALDKKDLASIQETMVLIKARP